MADVPDLGKVPASSPGPTSNKPESGTYGEKADAAALKSSLPSSSAPPPAPPMAPPDLAPVRPTPEPPGRPPTGAALPAGIPSALLRPTDRPTVPVNTPLEQAPMPVDTGAQQRLALLEMLSTSPDVSPTTRAWASHVMQLILGAQGTRLG